jgi:hypothetical protein
MVATPHGMTIHRTYLVSSADLPVVMAGDLLGTVFNTPTSGEGDLVRTSPRADAQFPELYAVKIASVKGIGVGTYIAGIGSLIPDGNIMPAYADFPLYAVTVEFSALPYTVVDGDEIDVTDDTYYDDSGNEVDCTITTEYMRYTKFEFRPNGGYITAKQGQMSFFTSGGGPNKTPFSDTPKIYMGDGTLLVTWYQVPEYYITWENSFINNSKGRVNQKPWLIWGPGQIRYDDYTTDRYTPPNSPITAYGLGTMPLLSPQKLIDITFQFSVTSRESVYTPFTPADPANKSFIAGGWNLQPWLTDRQFYYAVSVPAGSLVPASGMVPTWRSFYGPQILFTDPTV